MNKKFRFLFAFFLFLFGLHFTLIPVFSSEMDDNNIFDTVLSEEETDEFYISLNTFLDDNNIDICYRLDYMIEYYNDFAQNSNDTVIKEKAFELSEEAKILK